MKVRQNLYIDLDLSNALDALVIRRGGNKSRIVNEALKTWLARGASKEVDDLLKVRLDRISREVGASRRDIEVVLEITVPDDEIIKRMSGRRVHQPSGRTYHVEFNPPPENVEESRISFSRKLPTMNETKDLLIEEAMRRTGGNKSLAATMLGMTRQALTKREKREAK